MCPEQVCNCAAAQCLAALCWVAGVSLANNAQRCIPPDRSEQTRQRRHERVMAPILRAVILACTIFIVACVLRLVAWCQA